jgi:signal peptidase I
MYESIISNAWETLDVCEYFSDLIGSKITTVNDFIMVDKIICDFINMMRCVKENEKYEVSPINPMITDNFEIQFINGIEIVFENSFEPGEIKAYNSEREDIKIIKNVDYFENKRNNGFCLTYEKILEKNIHEIEVISKSGDHKQSFKVKDNLKLDNHRSLFN